MGERPESYSVNWKTIRIFVLDDDPGRIQKFRDRFSAVPDGIAIIWSAVDNVPESKRLLSNVIYDMVFLDHDLMEEGRMRNGIIIMVKEKPLKGSDLAQWLADNPEIAKSHGRYITHSLNKEGRDQIVASLQSIGITCEEAPFLWEETIFNKYVTWPDPE